MSELTKEKVYKNELIKAGATGDNNLERIRSLQNGGSASQNASPYVISYFDMVEIAKDKVIDVDTLVAILENKVPSFDTWATDTNGQTDLCSTTQVFTGAMIHLINLPLDSDNHTELVVNGDYLRTESTTNNVKQVLLLNKSAIEQVVFSTFSGSADKDYMGVIFFGNSSEQYPFTYDELTQIFKAPVTTSQEI